MSEIYNGSFVLGNTSATTISAGPGIKIDDSTPGVIKVSNDETVLYYNSAGVIPSNFPIQLNEPITNFETVKFYWQTFNYTGKNHTVSEKMTDVSDITLEGFIFNKNTSACFNAIWELESTNTTVNNISTKYINWTSTAAPGDASTFFSLYKIIGYNRKQNGGN